MKRKCQISSSPPLMGGDDELKHWTAFTSSQHPSIVNWTSQERNQFNKYNWLSRQSFFRLLVSQNRPQGALSPTLGATEVDDSSLVSYYCISAFRNVFISELGNENCYNGRYMSEAAVITEKRQFDRSPEYPPTTKILVTWWSLDHTIASQLSSTKEITE